MRYCCHIKTHPEQREWRDVVENIERIGFLDLVSRHLSLEYFFSERKGFDLGIEMV